MPSSSTSSRAPSAIRVASRSPGMRGNCWNVASRAWRLSNAGFTACTPASSCVLSDVSRPLYIPPFTKTPPTSSGPIRSRMNAAGALLDAHQRVVGEVPLVEDDHEHALRAVVGLVRVLAEDRAAGLVRDHVELFDLLRLAVLEDQEVLGAKAGGEAGPACRGRWRRLRRGRSTIGTSPGRPSRRGILACKDGRTGHQQEGRRRWRRAGVAWMRIGGCPANANSTLLGRSAAANKLFTADERPSIAESF